MPRMSLESAIRSQELAVDFSISRFHTLTDDLGGRRDANRGGRRGGLRGRRGAYLAVVFGEVKPRSLVTPAGKPLRQEGAARMKIVR